MKVSCYKVNYPQHKRQQLMTEDEYKSFLETEG